MLPAFLRYLRDNRYRVVHLVPAGAKTVSAAHDTIFLAERSRLDHDRTEFGVELQTIKAAFMAPSVSDVACVLGMQPGFYDR